jgi:hypothetical protein
MPMERLENGRHVTFGFGTTGNWLCLYMRG